MSAGRDRGVDAARGLAMILMTATHALRVLRPADLPELGQWLLRVEPVTPMLFFVIGGWSLAHSLRRSSDHFAWRKRHLLRAVGLWSLSAAMFFLYSGPQWPELLTSNGVLGCFAISVAVATVLGTCWIPATALLVASIGAWLVLDRQGIRIDGLNNGTFPVLPYLPVFLAAFLSESLLRRKTWPQLLATFGAAWVLFLSIRPGFRNLWGDWGITNTFQEYFRTPLHEFNGFAMAQDLIRGLPAIPHRVGFWAPRPGLVPVAVSLAGLSSLFLSAVSERFPNRLRPISLLDGTAWSTTWAIWPCWESSAGPCLRGSSSPPGRGWPPPRP
jgi:hypothetical protein